MGWEIWSTIGFHIFYVESVLHRLDSTGYSSVLYNALVTFGAACTQSALSPFMDFYTIAWSAGLANEGRPLLPQLQTRIQVEKW